MQLLCAVKETYVLNTVPPTGEWYLVTPDCGFTGPGRRSLSRGWREACSECSLMVAQGYNKEEVSS